jgi:hypothetical protein
VQPENIRPHLLIALPCVLCFKAVFEQTIKAVLNGLGNVDISIISDTAGRAKQLLGAQGIEYTEVKISTRLDAKSSLKKYSHVLVFWDGEELTDIVYYAKFLHKHLRIVPVQITKVRNRDSGDAFDVYIGRKTPWGNPYPIEHEPNGKKRDEVIEQFKLYFQEEFINNPENLKFLLTLRGLRLGCHCKPLSCHGDVIANFLNDYFDHELLVSEAQPA